jgi:hypothetical protein
MSISRVFFNSILCGLFFSACLQRPSLEPSPTMSPTVIPTPTAVENYCSKTKKEYKVFSMPKSWETISDTSLVDSAIGISFTKELEENIIHYLNNNGTPYQLQNDLDNTNEILSVDIREHDFDKDGEDEIAISFWITKPEFREVYFLIARCKVDKFEFAVNMNESGAFYGAPKILAIKDLNNDGNSEIVWRREWSGSDQMPFINILSWNEASKSFEDIFEKSRIPLGDVNITIGDMDNNGFDEIVFYGRLNHTGDLNTMVTYTYAWDGEFYKQIKEEITP